MGHMGSVWSALAQRATLAPRSKATTCSGGGGSSSNMGTKAKTAATAATADDALRSSKKTTSESDAAAISKATVRMPDLFVDILTGPYEPNPLYEQVKPKADEWTARVLKMDEQTAEASRKTDLVLLSASWAPRVDAAGLRLLADYVHWAFPWDDQFDEGPLQSDTVGAVQEIVSTLAILDDKCPPVSPDKDPLKYALQTWWLTFKERTSPYMHDRLRKHLRGYALGCLEQVVWNIAGRNKCGTDEFMGYRRLTVGTYPSIVMCEAATGLDLPQDVREHPAILACEAAIVDVVTIHNDILSMRKEVETGAEHNLICWLLDMGHSPQQAMDTTDAMLNACFPRWHEQRARVPSWGSPVDAQVAQLLDLFVNFALGSLHWTFRTGRYFGTEGAEIRRTRLLTLKLPRKCLRG